MRKGSEKDTVVYLNTTLNGLHFRYCISITYVVVPTIEHSERMKEVVGFAEAEWDQYEAKAFLSAGKYGLSSKQTVFFTDRSATSRPHRGAMKGVDSYKWAYSE